MEKRDYHKRRTHGRLCGFLAALLILWAAVSGMLLDPASLQGRSLEQTPQKGTGLVLAEADARISPYLLNAVVAVEDKRFYTHRGFDLIRILSAFWTNLQAGRVLEGGSTISQQYVKNAYLSPERTWSRKVQEAFGTIRLERQYSKEEILEMYLDTIYFGAGTFGITEASMFYFGLLPSELDLVQAATLAGIIKSPENFSPLNHPELSMTRRNLVLALMYEQKKIDKTQYVQALSAPLKLSKP